MTVCINNRSLRDTLIKFSLEGGAYSLLDTSVIQNYLNKPLTSYIYSSDFFGVIPDINLRNYITNNISKLKEKYSEKIEDDSELLGSLDINLLSTILKSSIDPLMFKIVEILLNNKENTND